MPAGSVIKAVMDLIATLNPAIFPGGVVPPVWLDEAPQQNSVGGQLHPPYIIMEDGGGPTEWTFPTNGIDSGKFTLTAYAVSMGDCDTIINGIMWNGQTPNQRQGVAFATLSLLSPLYTLGGDILPTTDQHSYAGFLDYQGKPVNRYSQEFKYKVGVSGTG